MNSSNSAGLVRQLSWLDGISLVVGSIVGSGIFASSGLVLRHVQGNVIAAIAVWLMSGMLAHVGALCYVELGSRYASAGGEIAYLQHGYAESSLLSYLFMWTNVVMTRPLSVAIISHIVAQYWAESATAMWQLDYAAGGALITNVKAGAVFFAIVTTAVLAFSTNMATFVLKFTTALKLVALGLIITLGGASYGSVAVQPPKPPPTTTSNEEGLSWLGGGVPQAFLSCLWAFDGWNSLNYASEELVDSSLLLRVISVALPGITALYAVTNLAYLAVVPIQQASATHTIAVDFIRLTWPSAEPVLLLCICVSTLGANVGSMFTGSRIVYSAAENGQLPAVFARLTVRGTPYLALALQLALTLGFLLLGDFEFLVELFGCVAWFFYLVTVIGLGRIKWREKEKEQVSSEYRVPWLALVVFVVMALGIVVSSLAAKPVNGAVSLVFVLAGVPVWAVWRRRSAVIEAAANDVNGVELIPPVKDDEEHDGLLTTTTTTTQTDKKT